MNGREWRWREGILHLLVILIQQLCSRTVSSSLEVQDKQELSITPSIPSTLVLLHPPSTPSQRASRSPSPSPSQCPILRDSVIQHIRANAYSLSSLPLALHSLSLATTALVQRQWKKVSAKGDVPSGRWGHTAVVHGSHMYVFGGFTDSSFNNDLFKFDFGMYWDLCGFFFNSIFFQCSRKRKMDTSEGRRNSFSKASSFSSRSSRIDVCLWRILHCQSRWPSSLRFRYVTFFMCEKNVRRVVRERVRWLCCESVLCTRAVSHNKQRRRHGRR